MLAFTSALACLSAIISGVAPVFGLKGVAPGDALKDGGRGMAGERRFSVRGALVIGQIAVSFTLVVAAGLFLRTFASLNQLPLGLRAAVSARRGVEPAGGRRNRRGARRARRASARGGGRGPGRALGVRVREQDSDRRRQIRPPAGWPSAARNSCKPARRCGSTSRHQAGSTPWASPSGSAGTSRPETAWGAVLWRS